MAYKTCWQATLLMPTIRADRRLQCCADPIDHSLDVPNVVEDIICYSYALVLYCIGFYLPRGYLSGLGSHCYCRVSSYKRLRQMSVLDKFS
jgi:hypothetical protein